MKSATDTFIRPNTTKPLYIRPLKMASSEADQLYRSSVNENSGRPMTVRR